MDEKGLLNCLQHAYDICCQKIHEYDVYVNMHTKLHDDNSAAYYQYLSDAEWRKADHIAKIIDKIKDLGH